MQNGSVRHRTSGTAQRKDRWQCAVCARIYQLSEPSAGTGLRSAPYAVTGENRLEIQCANGWAVGYLDRGNTRHTFADHISLAAELTVTAEDGSVITVGTDESWTVHRNAIRSAEFYHGETDDFTAPDEPLGYALPDTAPAACPVPDRGFLCVRSHRSAPRH